MRCNNLYSASALGIDGFLHSRERVNMQITNLESFKAKMQEFVEDQSSKNLIFTEDLKNFIHATKDQSDVKLLAKMIEKFNSQSKEVRFGNFVFGPPVMRLFYHLKDPETALAMFQDESLSGFFDQLVSYQIILDLLFISERYQDVLDTFEIIKSRQVQGGRFPKHVIVLALGACYKLNTKASLDFASKLFREANDAGHIPMRRGVTFLATLALQQSSPHVALEVVSNVRQQNYLTIRTIKALALADLKRFDDVVPILRSVLEIDNPLITKQTFPSDSIEKLKKAFEGNTNKDLQADFLKVVGFLEKHGHISQSTLDDILCAEIQQTAQVPGNDRYQRDNNRDYNRDYNNNSNNNREEYGRRDNRRGFQKRDFDYPSGNTRRPGLHELN